MQKLCKLGRLALLLGFLMPFSQVSAKYIDSRDLAKAKAELSKLMTMIKQSPNLAGGIKRVQPILSHDESTLLPHQQSSRGHGVVFPSADIPSAAEQPFTGEILSDDRGFYTRHKDDAGFARKITNILLELVFSDEDYLDETLRSEAEQRASLAQKVSAFNQGEEERFARLQAEAASSAERRQLAEELKALKKESARTALEFEKRLRKEATQIQDALVKSYYQAYEKKLLTPQ